MLGEDVQNVCGDGDGGSQSREAVHAPAKCDSNPRKLVLECLTKKNEPGESNDPSRVYAPEAIFRLILASMGSDIAIAKEVIKPVTPKFGADGANHRREKEKRKRCVAEQVGGWQDEL